MSFIPSNNLERRIAVIKSIIHHRQLNVTPENVSRFNTLSTSHVLPFAAKQCQGADPQVTHLISCMSPSMRGSAASTGPTSFSAASTCMSTMTEDVVTRHVDTASTTVPSPSKEEVNSVNTTSVEDEEDALWAQLDDVPAENPISSSSPLRPIGNISDRLQPVGNRQTFKSAESSSRDANRVDLINTP